MSTTSITATTARQRVPQGRLGVPWLTAMPLAVVLAYADGFWMTSLRGAVGSIERTQGPFASWLRESTIVLPFFVLAVLGALTLALRLFGSELRRSTTVLATALLVVGSGTVVGIAEMAASSAYDYYLQSGQLQLMDAMRDTCAGGRCLAQEQQASLWLQVRAVGYGSGILLVTNLILVGWVVAIRGGRLNLSRTLAADQAHANRTDGSRLLLAAGLFGSAAIHAAVAPEHLSEWAAAGVFFLVLAAAQLAVAALLLVRRQPVLLLAAALASLGPLALWLYARTVGMPFGPGAGVPERIGLADCAACVLQVSTLLAAVVLLRGRGRPRRRPTSAHVTWLTLVAVTAVTVIGLAGSGLPWFEDFAGSGGQSVMAPPH